MNTVTLMKMNLLFISITISLLVPVDSLHTITSTKLLKSKYFTHTGRMHNSITNLHRCNNLYEFSSQATNTVGKSNFAVRSSLNDELIGEDSAAFNVENESLQSWLTFLVAVSGVLSVVFYAWIYDSGLHWGDQFKAIMESISGGDSTWAITYMLGVFAVSHSGLASLRPYAENIVGARVWRYVFALVSLPLAFSCITYFINHR